MFCFYPIFLFQLFPEYLGYNRKVNIIKEQKKFFMAEIKRHQETLDVLNPRDFIDVYLAAIESGENDALTMEDLAVAIGDMFVAGTETSSTTLKWTLLYLCLHQDIQDKCRDEIKHVLGANERCKMSHLTSLPYTLATITEIQRVARVAPSSLLHKTSSPTTIEGYNFPAKSVFTANLSHITHDPSIIKDPHYFNPQRWIGQDGR